MSCHISRKPPALDQYCTTLRIPEKPWIYNGSATNSRFIKSYHPRARPCQDTVRLSWQRRVCQDYRSWSREIVHHARDLWYIHGLRATNIIQILGHIVLEKSGDSGGTKGNVELGLGYSGKQHQSDQARPTHR